MTPPDVTFTIDRAEILRFAAAPHIVFKLRVRNDSPLCIHSVILKCQINLDVSHRHYNTHEQQRLADLFGEPHRWAKTVRNLLWTNTMLVLPSFDENVVADLQVPCTFDFNVAATKYFAGIEDGEVPTSFYFNGTIFYAGEDGALQVSQIPWEKEASYRMPIHIWREMMDAYYPNTAWLCLEREVFERLYAYKVQHGIPTFEQALVQAVKAVSG
jgi:hypothetical protein